MNMINEQNTQMKQWDKEEWLVRPTGVIQRTEPNSKIKRKTSK